MSKIFISYRRDHVADLVDILADHVLQPAFGEESVFRDVQIPKGHDFGFILRQKVSECDLLLAVIDDRWLTVVDKKRGFRRLDNPEDWVRIEIEGALDREIPVIPLLVDNAQMPDPSELPQSLRALAYRNAMALSDKRLVDSIRGCLATWDSLREPRRHFFQQWEGGDWLAAARAHEVLLERASKLTNLAVRAVIESEPMKERQRIARILVEVGRAIDRQDFRTAAQRLDEVSASRLAPPNCQLARRILTVGVRLSSAIEAEEPTGVDELQREYTEIVDETMRTKSVAVVPGEREVRSLFRRFELEKDYAEAVQRYHRGEISDARDAFERLGEYRNASRSVALCDTLLEVRALLRARRWEDAREQLQRVPQADQPTCFNHWRAWCNQLRKVGPALERMSAAPLLPARAVPWSSGAPAYTLLGVSPSASEKECRDLAFVLSERGGMTDAQRLAWDSLRLSERRLEVDAGLYHVAKPELAKRALEAICEVADAVDPLEELRTWARSLVDDGEATERPTLRELVGSTLGEDEGIFLAESGHPDGAVEFFVAAAGREPHHPSKLHHLALACAEKLASANAGSDDLSEVLDRSIWSAAAVLADDRFWHQLWASRCQVYRVVETQLKSLREEAAQRWLERVNALRDRHPELVARSHAELAAARRVNESGGLQRPGSASAELIVVGFLGSQALQLQTEVAEWVRAEAADPEEQSRRRVLFSQLAEPAALLEMGAYDEVVEQLGRRTAAGPEFDKAANPGFSDCERPRLEFQSERMRILSDAHLKLGCLAATAVPARVEPALESWRQAAALARQRGSGDQVAREIREFARGRAAFLSEGDSTEKRTPEQLLDRLNDAVELLEGIIAAGWDAEDQVVKHALVEALLDRAVLLSNKWDMEKEARHDARRAWVMSPNHHRAIVTLCFATLHYAKEVYVSGKQALARTLVEETREMLGDKGAHYPEDRKIAECIEALRRTAHLIEDGAIEAVRNSIRESKPDERQAATKARQAEADAKQAIGEYTQAAEILWELLREQPGDRFLTARLAWCYRSWIFREVESKAPPSKVREILDSAVARCGESEALRDIVEALRGSEVT